MTAVMDYKRKIYAIRDLPVLPVIAQRVLSLADDDERGPDRLAQLISSDQSLSVKVLSLANSAYYGQRAKIATVKHAVMLIGMSMLKQISLTVLVCGTLGRGGKKREEFWMHSFATATASTEIARRAGITQSEVCYTAGLLHDVGRAIIDTYFPGEKGMDHTEVGSWMAERWQLPQELVEAIAHHHSTDPEHLSKPITACVHAANLCAEAAFEVEPAPEPVSFEGIPLRLKQQDFLEVIADLQSRRSEIERMFK
jgi:putative nucleotidyltransferase with HDIG domain